MDITKDIRAMIAYRNNSAKFLRHLRKTKRTLVLTVNGKAASVVQDAEAYQHLLDLVAEASAAEASGRDLKTLPMAGHGRRAKFWTRYAPNMTSLN